MPALGLRASPGDLILGLSWQRQNTRRASVGAFARSSSGRLLSSEVFGRFAFFFFIYYECILSCAASLGRYVSERQGDEVN